MDAEKLGMTIIPPCIAIVCIFLLMSAKSCNDSNNETAKIRSKQAYDRNIEAIKNHCSIINETIFCPIEKAVTP